MSLRADDPYPRKLLIKIVAVAIVIVVLVIATYVALRPKPSEDAGAVVGYSAPPTTHPLSVVILRGGTTGCQPTGGCNDANYAQVLAAKEGWNMTVVAQGGTGYINGSDTNPSQDFASRLPAVFAANPDLVIVEGSVSDQYYSGAAVEQAAVAVFTSLKTHLPNAKVVVVGPAWAGTAPADVVAIENAVKDASVGRAALFVDPIAQGWFAGAYTALMSSDHQSPTDQGHARMAAMLEADLAPLLHQQASSSSPAT